MEQSTVLAILKCVFIVLFIAIVIIVGLLPLRMSTFRKNKFLKAMGPPSPAHCSSTWPSFTSYPSMLMQLSAISRSSMAVIRSSRWPTC